MLGPEFGQEPLPEGQGLGVGVVDPEDRHSVGDPQFQDALDLAVDPLRVVVEVERVDVLVLLRRVLRVGDGAVGPGGEPFGVLGQPRVVRRALEGDVEGHLHAVPLRLLDEVVEVLEGAELGVDGVVPSLGRPDRVGAARVARLGDERVVATLAVSGPDRVDGSEVDDVEAHAGDAVQAPGGRAERAGLPRPVGRPPGAYRPREDLVPRADERADAVDVQRVGVRLGDQVAHGGGGQGLSDLLRRGGGEALVGGELAVGDGGLGALERGARLRPGGSLLPRPLEEGLRL